MNSERFRLFLKVCCILCYANTYVVLFIAVLRSTGCLYGKLSRLIKRGLGYLVPYCRWGLFRPTGPHRGKEATVSCTVYQHLHLYQVYSQVEILCVCLFIRVTGAIQLDLYILRVLRVFHEMKSAFEPVNIPEMGVDGSGLKAA